MIVKWRYGQAVIQSEFPAQNHINQMPLGRGQKTQRTVPQLNFSAALL